MKTLRYWLWGVWLALLSSTAALASDETNLLDPAQAFTVTVTAPAGDSVVVHWTIAEGYYLYRERFRFESLTAGIDLQQPHFPVGEIKNDPFSGSLEIYRGKIAVAIPLSRAAGTPPRLELKTTFQGCAEVGVCYPPQTQIAAIELPSPLKADPLAMLMTLGKSPTGNASREQLLEPEQAFRLSLTAPSSTTIIATWDIAEGYYLYRNQLQLELIDAGDLTIVGVDIPAGEPKEDEFFGRQEVFHRRATAIARLQGAGREQGDLKLRVSYQGCAEIGVCYPPVSQILPVVLPVPEAGKPGKEPTNAGFEAEQDRMARMLTEKRFWALPAFFGFGLLLAFTPCVFPMVPILSSLIAGQGETLTQRRAFMLSLTYVLAMAVTYTLAGVLAALLGQNIQALFQNPWVLAGFSALFVLLALSMFDLYNLQLPHHWQSRLTELSNNQRGGSYLGVAIMGLLSALIVSPCVAPPLIGILTVIAATASDALLGGTALFVMSLGMGVPLLVIGTSAGRLLPRAGHWMKRTKAVFGVLLLALAIWMLERILPAEVGMLLWATLLIVSATYMGALQPLAHGVPAGHTLIKGLGVVLLIYGILLLVGVASGGKDSLQPLRGVSLFTSGSATPIHSPFLAVKTVADLEQALAQARGRPLMLDFYADWCATCHELEKYTFSNPRVQAYLSGMALLRADVTANDVANQIMLQRFALFGPPAILFFGPDGKELKAFRIVGYMPPERFIEHIGRLNRQ